MLYAKTLVLKEEYDNVTLSFQIGIFVNEKLKDQLLKDFVNWVTLKEFTPREVYMSFFFFTNHTA